MTSHLTPEEQAKHVTIWNRLERRKIAGNAAPLRRNLASYLERNPEWEEYRGQDKDPNLRPGAIDPITGERIAVQNEHVPIWHRADRRKVTGNAAPLRKNLESYLRKYPDCEVYNGQDKVHRFAQARSSTASRTVSASRSNAQASSQLAGPQQNPSFSHPHEHHTHQPVRRWIYAPNRNSGWGSTNAQQGQASTQIQIQSSNNNHAHNNAELSYMEMASSWSNNPEWINQGAPHTPLTPGAMNGFHGLPQSFSSNFGPMSPMDFGDTSISGIPIPGGVSRDRHDLSMGASYGAGTTPMDASGILGETPRSMDGDPDAMQFSPSYYLLGSFQGRSPPPIRISQSFFKPAVAPGTQN